MTAVDFDALLERRLAATRAVLGAKAAEYASGADRLHNFKRAAALLGTGPGAALVGMWAKHLVSVLDIVARFEREPNWRPAPELLDEKIGDTINYAILLEAVFSEVRT